MCDTLCEGGDFFYYDSQGRCEVRVQRDDERVWGDGRRVCVTEMTIV